MPAGKMHIDEVATDVKLVSKLLASQFPRWADLPIKRVQSDGTDNAIYRLGDDMVVRLPLIHWAVTQVNKAHKWLPKLAPYLPLAIPTPLAKGKPDAQYPWPWSIYRWLPGENAVIDHLHDPHQTACDLAAFINALQQIDTTDAPGDSDRGEPLARRDRQTRKALASLHGMFDTAVMAAVWDAAVTAPVWPGPAVWIHGDLKPGNLLAVQGQLSAIIDFGGLGVGDPACDVMAAWLFLSGETRATFRTALKVDAATWARGRGWALSVGVIALPYYQTSNPGFAAIAKRAIAETLDDYWING